VSLFKSINNIINGTKEIRKSKVLRKESRRRKIKAEKEEGVKRK